MVPFRKIKPMRTACLPIITILALTLVSCADSSKADKEIMKEMEKSLKSSNNTIANFTVTTLKKLENKKYEVGMREKANVWLPKAHRIITITRSCFEYIETLKKINKISPEKSDELFNKLNKYQEAILGTDTVLKIAFADMPESCIIFTPSDSSRKDFYNRYFNHSSKELLSGFLTEIQNRIRNFEAKTVVLCNEQVGAMVDYFESHEAIIGQNANILKQGSELEITAGIGLFSIKANPEIYINGEKCSLNDFGYSFYKKKIRTKPGSYSIPVKIKFTDQDGKENIVEQSVEYTVAKECDQ